MIIKEKEYLLSVQVVNQKQGGGWEVKICTLTAGMLHFNINLDEQH